MFSWFRSKSETPAITSAVTTAAPKKEPIENASFTSRMAAAKKSTLTEDGPVSSPVDPAIDALEMVKTEFQEKAMAIQKSLEAWEKMERLVFASGKVDIHPVIEPQRKKSLIERIKSLLSQAGKEIKEHLETPNTYLTELLIKVSPAFIDLRQKLEKEISDLETLTTSNPFMSQEKEQKARQLRANICDLSIAIENGMQALINNVLSEIEYCLEFENVTEALVAGILNIELGKFPIPVPSFNMGSLYRKGLYDKTHDPLAKIDDFITESLGNTDRARQVLEKKPGQQKTSFFWKPDENVRDAPLLKDRSAPEIKRSNSLPSFRSY